VQLWSTKSGDQVVCFYHAEKPVFTLDGKYLLYIDSGQTLITYCLNRMAPVRYVACQADELLVLPVKHGLVVLTCWQCSSPAGSGTCSPAVTVWDFQAGESVVSLSGVAAGGLLDVSKDGRLAVDSSLRVFSLETGCLLSRVGDDDVKDVTLARLTDDGQYVVWVEALSVKVGRVSDGSLVGHTCTHERTASLCTLDCGYVLVVGREDGRILMMSIVTDRDQGDNSVTLGPRTADDRRTAMMHSADVCSQAVKAGFDVLYQGCVQSVKDVELPRASESIRAALTQRARAPLLSTAMSKPAPAPADSATDKYRRSYSHMPLHASPLGDLHRETASASSSAWCYHDLASTTQRYHSVDDLSASLDAGPDADLAAGSVDDSDVMTPPSGVMIDRRSHSVTDMTLVKHDASRGDKSSPGEAASPSARPPTGHKLLGYLWGFGATIRKRKKYRRHQLRPHTDNRDRMPSV